MNKIELQTPKGYHVFVSQFIPMEQAKAVILITSATGVKQTLYLKFAKFLCEKEFIVYTFDYGGIGESKTTSLKRFDTTASHWATNDTQTVLKHIKTTHPNLPIYAIGHSIGGQLLGLVPSNRFFDGIILVAAQMGYWRMWKSIKQKYMMALLWYAVMPITIKLKGYFLGKFLGNSEDLPKSMALEWRSWCLSPDYLFDHVQNAHKSFKKIRCPLYSISAFDDNFAPKNAVDSLTNKYSKTQSIRIHLTPQNTQLKSIGHFGYFRSDKKIVWQQILKLLEKF